MQRTLDIRRLLHLIIFLTLTATLIAVFIAFSSKLLLQYTSRGKQQIFLRSPNLQTAPLESHHHPIQPIPDANDKISSAPAPPTQPAPLLALNKATRCPIYTYFEIVKINSNHRAKLISLLRLWLRNWYHAGFEPKILTMKDAQKHPRYNYYKDHFSKYPTVNDREYELACYLRWLAFREVGGGTMIDFDMFSFDYQLPKEATDCGRESGIISIRSYWPMFLHTNVTGIDKIIESMHDYKPNDKTDLYQGRPHTSDMLILRKYYKELLAMEFPTLPAIGHFATELLSRLRETLEKNRNLQKSEWVNTMLQLHFLNTHRVTILHPPELMPIGALGLKCPFPKNIETAIPLYPSSSTVLPRRPSFTCSVLLQPLTAVNFSNLKENKDKHVAHLIIVLLHRRASCQPWEQLRELFTLPNVIPVLMDDWQRSSTLLEYSMGFVLGPDQPAFNLTISHEREKEACKHYNEITRISEGRLQNVLQFESQLNPFIG